MRAIAVDDTQPRSKARYTIESNGCYLVDSSGKVAQLTFDEMCEAVNKRYPPGCDFRAAETDAPVSSTVTKIKKVNNGDS